MVEPWDEAIALLERGWTQGTFARDASGAACAVLDGPAICYCAVGALTAASKGHGVYAMEIRLLSVVRDPIVYWNDRPDQTKGQVIAAFKCAKDHYEQERQSA